MKIYVTKTNDGFKVHCPELQLLKNEISYYDDIEATDEDSAESALYEFNDSILKDFIEYYFLEHKPKKEEVSPLFNNLTFEYIFDKASFKNYYLENPVVYGDDEDEDKSDKKSTPKVKKFEFNFSFPPKKKTISNKHFTGKKIFVSVPLFGKTIVPFSVIFNKLKEIGAIQQKSLNKDTEIVVFMGKKQPADFLLKKIKQLNENGANIVIIDEKEFIEKLGIEIN